MNEKIISVKFLNGINNKNYVFKCFDDVTVGDTVVVDTVNGFQLATVTETNSEPPKGTVLKEVVAIVDMSEFNARKERADKIKKLKEKMNKRVKELQDIAVYEMLAKTDSALAEMLDELKSL